MVYLSIFCAALALYALFLNRRITVLKKNLKELIQENERQTTENSPALSDIYFKVDRDMVITYANESKDHVFSLKQSRQKTGNH